MSFSPRTWSPLNQRRWANFRANKRGFWSFWLFLCLFVLALGAEFISNDKPLLVHVDGRYYMPVFVSYPETAFGGDFETETRYRDPYVKQLIESKSGWTIWPLIPYSYDTINYDLRVPAPAPPSADNWLGTDDQGRDVLARIIYGFRISVLFGLTLTMFSSLIGVAAGAVQGFFGGLTDLFMQRFMGFGAECPFCICSSSWSYCTAQFLVASRAYASFFVDVAIMSSSASSCARAILIMYELRRALGRPLALSAFKHMLPNAASLR